MLVSQEASFYFLGFGTAACVKLHVALDVDDEACGCMKMTLETNNNIQAQVSPVTPCKIMIYLILNLARSVFNLTFLASWGKPIRQSQRLTLQLAVQIDQRHLAPFYVGVAIAEAEERSFLWEMVSERIQWCQMIKWHQRSLCFTLWSLKTHFLEFAHSPSSHCCVLNFCCWFAHLKFLKHRPAMLLSKPGNVSDAIVIFEAIRPFNHVEASEQPW